MKEAVHPRSKSMACHREPQVYWMADPEAQAWP